MGTSCDKSFSSDEGKAVQFFVNGQTINEISFHKKVSENNFVRVPEVKINAKAMKVTLANGYFKTIFLGMNYELMLNEFKSDGEQLFKRHIKDFLFSMDKRQRPTDADVDRLYPKDKVMEFMTNIFKSKYNIVDTSTGLYQLFDSSKDFTGRVQLDAAGYLHQVDLGNLSKGLYELWVQTVDSKGMITFETFIIHYRP